MGFWLLLDRAGVASLSCGLRRGFDYQQRFGLVNVKLKWVKDKALDAAVVGERDVKAACNLVSIIASAPDCRLPIYVLSKHRGQLGLPNDLKLSAFMRRYPTIFHEFHVRDTGGTPVPFFELTSEAQNLHDEELGVLHHNLKDLLDRLCKLLMLTKDRTLPLQTIDQLRWDLGLPYYYTDSLIPHCADLFSLIRLPDDRVGLKLVSWKDNLAVSHLQKYAVSEQDENVKSNCLAFPVKFTRGYGLKRKCMEWLEEWQRLPYTSPYAGVSHLDPRTDVSEKRIVGVFHELLHLTVRKMTERKNVSNLRDPLSLPQKFTKVFERHPGIFYISKKSDTQTVVLREAYDRQRLIHKHPLLDIREKISAMMREGFVDRSRGVYKKTVGSSAEDPLDMIFDDKRDCNRLRFEPEVDHDVLSECNSNTPISDSL